MKICTIHEVEGNHHKHLHPGLHVEWAEEEKEEVSLAFAVSRGAETEGAEWVEGKTGEAHIIIFIWLFCYLISLKVFLYGSNLLPPFALVSVLLP